MTFEAPPQNSRFPSQTVLDWQRDATAAEVLTARPKGISIESLLVYAEGNLLCRPDDEALLTAYSKLVDGPHRARGVKFLASRPDDPVWAHARDVLREGR